MDVLSVYNVYKFICVNRNQCYNHFMDQVADITVTFEWHADVNNSTWIGTHFVKPKWIENEFSQPLRPKYSTEQW